MAGMSAEAAPKPIPMTFFLHGTQPLGEIDPDPVVGGSYKAMDTTAPSGAQSKSQQVLNYVGGPNTECAGNALFPLWVGTLGGEVSGPMTISLSTLSMGGAVEIRVFADIEAQACNEEFPKVAGSVTATAPAGQGKLEATIPNVKLKAKSSFMIQLSPVGLTPDQTRVFYDSTADPSSITFSCTPKDGKTAC
jgi:hypothetical protein